MKNALIFGGNGQDGIYMSELCKEKGIKPIAISRSPGLNEQGSIADKAFVEEVIQKYLPAFIFHLAANSTTRHEALLENHETIATGTLHVLEAALKYAPHAKILLAGSGLQFENQGQPIAETAPFRANNAYAIARIQSVYAARYFRDKGLKVYVAYLFHHESPYRKPHHLGKMIVETIKRIQKGSREKLVIGDVTVEKEWGFAGDITKGMFQLVNQEKVFEATIGTGKAYSVQQFLKGCFDLAKLDLEGHVTHQPGFIPEYNRLVSEPSTINSLGWYPEVSFEQMIQLMWSD
jgi:GDPmannose 4,6-dehydratase